MTETAVQVNLNQIISCPHCNEFIIIEQLNCCIFRHGTIKATGVQMDPHTNEEECNRLFLSGLIYGCGKPFKLVKSTTHETYIVEVCGYI